MQPASQWRERLCASCSNTSLILNSPCGALICSTCLRGLPFSLRTGHCVSCDTRQEAKPIQRLSGALIPKLMGQGDQLWPTAWDALGQAS